MSKKTKYRGGGLKNDLDWLDPDQELAEEYAEESGRFEKRPTTLRESISRGLRGTLAIIICLVIPVLWYFDWNPSAIANKTSEVVTGIFDDGSTVEVAPAPIVGEVPEPAEAPEPAEVGVGSGLDMNITDYAAELNKLGYLDKLSSPAVTALYQNDVPIDYLTQLDNSGYLDEFSFPAIISFHQNNVPIEYLNQLEGANFLSEFSFPAVVAYYQNNVAVEYLQQLNVADFLDDFSFPAVVAFYQNQVTVDFLNELKEKDLIDQLSFPDIVNMFNNR